MARSSGKPVNIIISGISRLLSISTRYPWFTIITVTVITLLLGGISSRLVINNDYDTWLPEGDPLTVLYKEVNNTFNAAAVALVALDLGDVFTEEGIEKIRRTTEAIEAIPGVFSVMSLANVIDFREEEGTIEVARLGDRIEPTPEGLNAFRDYVLSRELYAGTFVSRDARFANIIINILDEAEEVEVSKVIKETVENMWEKEKTYLGGDPVYTAYIDQYMMEDLSVTGPLALGFMVLVLLFSFRSGWGALLPLSLAGVAVIWLMGIKALVGWPLNVMTSAVLVLVLAMGSDYAVHVLNRFRSPESGDEPSLEIAPPVIMSALTTIVGLLTFATTDIAVLKWFGAEIAVGLAITMFLSLTLLPSIMHAFGSRLMKKWQAPKDRPDRFTPIAARLGGWGIRHRVLVLGSLAVAVIAAALGMTRIKTSSNYLEMLPEDSLPRRASYIFRDHFVGSYAQTIYVKGAVDHPSLLKAMIRIENFHRSLPDFSGYSSIADLIAEENHLVNGTYSIPDTREGVSSLWLLLEGDPMLRNLVTPDRTRAIVNAYTGLEDGRDMKRVSYTVDDFLAEETGDTLVTLDRQKLSPDLDEKILQIILRETARELTRLAMYYSDYAVGEESAGPIRDLLEGRRIEPLTVKETEDLADRSERYTEKELFISDPGAKEEIRRAVTKILNSWKNRDIWAEAVLPELYTTITRVPLDERTLVIRDLAGWIEAEVRRIRVGRVAAELAGTLPEHLGPHFEKRARGALAELYSPLPVFFSVKLRDLAIPPEAVASEMKTFVRQMGIPTFYEIFDRLLHRSQIQSLGLASFFVFFMIWIGLQIVRGAFFALSSVLVSIILILGFMGGTGIPLDYGTVLTGGLIIGLGVDGVIHIIYHFRRSRLKPEEITVTVSEVGRAITTANFTTTAGLFSLVLSKISATINFGLINGMAILIVTILNLVLVPLLIVLFPIPNSRGNQSGTDGS